MTSPAQTPSLDAHPLSRSAESQPPVLEAVHLTKRYGTHVALDGLDLRIKPGEVFCLLGANGAGKTTTIKLFLNETAPTSGAVRIKGLDVATRPIETKRAIAYIPEQVMLYGSLTGLENLEYFAALADVESPSRRQLLEILQATGITPEIAGRSVSTYSKGMRQKVGIALAIAKNAEALLLDEPTSGLDPKAANEFSTLLRAMSRRGSAVLMVTHDIFRAKETASKIGIMKGGRLVDVLPADQIGVADLERIYLEHMHD